MVTLLNIFYLKEGLDKKIQSLHTCSPLLWKFCSLEFRQNEQIKGICISDHELKISAYSDDANFLVSDIQSLNCLFLTCTDFGNYSSLRLNEEKSEASWIGNKKSNTSKPLSCKWSVWQMTRLKY